MDGTAEPSPHGRPADRGPHDGGLQELVLQAERAFTARFGRNATHLVRAPGRINLIGEHIDYNDGLVLPMAVERNVVIAAALNAAAESQTANWYSQTLQQQAMFRWDEPLQPDRSGWANYVKGVIAGYLEPDLAFPEIPAFDAVVVTDLPLGGGLSSSAALEVAAAMLVESFTGCELAPERRVHICQQAEHRFAGVPCGIMDQYSSVFGSRDQLMLLDCQKLQLEYVPFIAPQLTILITHSQVQHELAASEYAVRRQQCDSALAKLNSLSWRDVFQTDLQRAREQLSEVEFRRARHVISEIMRTRDAADALRRSQWEELGQLMYASHASLRDDFEVSCAELDALVQIARDIGPAGGVWGSRMTGGGFGGCTVSLVERRHVDAIEAQMVRAYQAETGRQATCFTSHPSDGAQVLRGVLQ